MKLFSKKVTTVGQKKKHTRITSLLFPAERQKILFFCSPSRASHPPMIWLYFKWLGRLRSWGRLHSSKKRGFCLSTSPLCSLLLCFSLLSALEELTDPPAQLLVCLHCRQALIHCGLIVSLSLFFSFPPWLSVSFPLIFSLHPSIFSLSLPFSCKFSCREPCPPSLSALSSHLLFYVHIKLQTHCREISFACLQPHAGFSSQIREVGGRRNRSVGGRKRTWEQMVQLNTTCRPLQTKRHVCQSSFFPDLLEENIEGQIY